MPKSTTFDSQILDLVLNGTTITGLAINTTTSPLTSLYVALHTTDPTAAGNQSSNEIAYSGYARVAINRNSTTKAWTITNGSASPAAYIQFPQAAAGQVTTVTAAYWSVGTASTGAGTVLYSGPISPNIGITAGVTPQLTTNSTITES